jgi:hypothetical protein
MNESHVTQLTTHFTIFAWEEFITFILIMYFVIVSKQLASMSFLQQCLNVNFIIP